MGKKSNKKTLIGRRSAKIAPVVKREGEKVVNELGDEQQRLTESMTLQGVEQHPQRAQLFVVHWLKTTTREVNKTQKKICRLGDVMPQQERHQDQQQQRHDGNSQPTDVKLLFSKSRPTDRFSLAKFQVENISGEHEVKYAVKSPTSKVYRVSPRHQGHLTPHDTVTLTVKHDSRTDLPTGHVYINIIHCHPDTFPDGTGSPVRIVWIKDIRSRNGVGNTAPHTTTSPTTDVTHTTTPATTTTTTSTDCEQGEGWTERKSDTNGYDRTGDKQRYGMYRPSSCDRQSDGRTYRAGSRGRDRFNWSPCRGSSLSPVCRYRRSLSRPGDVVLGDMKELVSSTKPTLMKMADELQHDVDDECESVSQDSSDGGRQKNYGYYYDPTHHPYLGPLDIHLEPACSCDATSHHLPHSTTHHVEQRVADATHFTSHLTSNNVGTKDVRPLLDLMAERNARRVNKLFSDIFFFFFVFFITFLVIYCRQYPTQHPTQDETAGDTGDYVCTNNTAPFDYRGPSDACVSAAMQ